MSALNSRKLEVTSSNSAASLGEWVVPSLCFFDGRERLSTSYVLGTAVPPVVHMASSEIGTVNIYSIAC